MTTSTDMPASGWTFRNLSAKIARVGNPDWQRLGTYVTRRRHELGLTQPQVQAAGGPSAATVRNIESATQTSYRDGILRALERALKWPSGAVDSILAGGEPEDAQRPPAPTNAGHVDVDQLTAAEEFLRAIRDNENRSALLRSMAAAQLDQIAAIRAANIAEEEQSRGAAS
jgi:hypothetical protein